MKKNFLISLISFLILTIVIFYGNIISNTNLLLISSIITCVFILFYSPNKFNKLIFENKILVFIGNISYSFYLWHLPIIYFYNLYFVDNFLKIPLILFLTLLLSALSFIFIEEKFRYKKFLLSKKNLLPIFVSFLLIISSITYLAFQKSYNSKFKLVIKNLIYKINYLENKKDFTNRTVFYKININGNEIYRFCTEGSKNPILNEKKLRSKCLKKGTKSNNILILEGNSHTANFVPMVNSLNLKDDFYFEHKSNLFNKINYSKVNSLSRYYEKIIYATYIDNLNDLKNSKILKIYLITRLIY